MKACAIVRSVGGRAVRMIFDTAHIQSMDGDLLGRLERERISSRSCRSLTIRAAPSRRSARSTWPRSFMRSTTSGYRGMVELEHLWSAPGEAVERRGIDWLRSFEASISKSNNGALG